MSISYTKVENCELHNGIKCWCLIYCLTTSTATSDSKEENLTSENARGELLTQRLFINRVSYCCEISAIFNNESVGLDVLVSYHRNMRFGLKTLLTQRWHSEATHGSIFSQGGEQSTEVRFKILAFCWGKNSAHLFHKASNFLYTNISHRTTYFSHYSNNLIC